LLTQIDVVYSNELGEQALALPILGVTPKDSLLVRKVTGLNPPDIDLFIGEYSRDGGIYQGRRVKNRNVVLTMDLNPNPAFGETISGLREILYKTFVDPLVDADYIELILHDDENAERYLVGYTEKFETEIFDVETLAQISMICPDPYIRDSQETVLSHATGWLTVPFVYTGTAETGFEVRIHLTANTPTLTFSNNDQTMILTHPFVAGDIVRINTNRGEREVTLDRGGVVSSLLAKLSNVSRWLELHSQANQMKVYGATVASTPAVVRELKYVAKYWGI